MLQLLAKCSDLCGGNENHTISGDDPMKIYRPRHLLNFLPMFPEGIEATFFAQAVGPEMILQGLAADLTKDAFGPGLRLEHHRVMREIVM